MMVADAEHTRWMHMALEEARLAAQEGEVPVGAVVVAGERLLARERNRTLQLGDPTAHAELLAVRAAAAALGNHRLQGCRLYVTLEPCAMCTGAVFQSRLDAVIYAAREPKTGMAGSVLDLYANAALNHHTRILGGVLESQARQLLAEFFARRRRQQQAMADDASRSGARLRDDALRTPQSCFSRCPPEGCYTTALAGLDGLRLHYQQCEGGSGGVFLLLHPMWHWSAWWQPLIEVLQGQGCRILAPDLAGWGRSDKPRNEHWHSLHGHAAILADLLQCQAGAAATLVAQDDSEALALALARLAPQHSASVVVLKSAVPAGLWPARASGSRQKSWSVAGYLGRRVRQQLDVDIAAAPYPDAGHARHWAVDVQRFTAGHVRAGAIVAELPRTTMIADVQSDAAHLAQQLIDWQRACAAH